MEIFKTENLSFTYPNREKPALNNINLSVLQGEFITICGTSGCGKTTLLRMLKSTLAPFGTLNGCIYFKGRPLSNANSEIQAEQIGFVMQDPDNQIVTDKVWHELAFGLESLGYTNTEIRTKVAEMAAYFGIQNWFHKKTTELSGGQKQLLNLASIMVMQPSVLILDEPTSQLDPIAAQEFFNTLKKLNSELGTTIIVSEHRLEDAFPLSDRIIVMDEGKIIADERPEKIGVMLKNNKMHKALPTPVRIHNAVENSYGCPVTVGEGKVWLEKLSASKNIDASLIPKAEEYSLKSETIIEIRDVWYRYDKELPDVIKGLNLKVKKGEFLSVLGGNGTGKTTALSIISGLITPYRGKVLINGKELVDTKDLYYGVMGVLPQNPQTLFVKKTVYLDLIDMLSEMKLEKTEIQKRVNSIADLCRITELLQSHPYDLSGGEQQRVALAKILLQNPDILLLDEPTKGMDAHFKDVFAEILNNLKASGVTIIMVSHDIEFCAEHADRCAFMFDGCITSSAVPREFFSGNSFYTTAANRMARNILPNAVLANDIIVACGGKTEKCINKEAPVLSISELKSAPQAAKTESKPKVRIISGIIFAVLFIIIWGLQTFGITEFNANIIQIIGAAAFAGSIICLFPKKENVIIVQQPLEKRRLSKRTAASLIFVLIAVPVTIFSGIYYFGDRKYYLISLLIIFETLIPFFTVFESKKPQARELIIISVLCAIAVSGRTAFFMLPQFKPVIALVIISGVCFGAESGFLVGTVTVFVSNFFFGQGPWTPWQMFAFGIIGFLAGLLFDKGFIRKTKLSLSVFGFFATVIIYGGIINPASVIMYQQNPTLEMFLSSYAMGLPFDLIHGGSTVFFLWVVSEPMIEKLERIKIKYGLIKR